MLKVLIVDDDVFFHTYLNQLIDWENEGFELCGVAVNGNEAIQLIDGECPDIVITDMSMPGMDGVAVIKYLQKAHPRSKAIALSAYHDFDYVRQSLKTGAIDYILKHTLTAEVLIGILNTVKQSFIQEERNDEERRRIDEQLQTGKFFLQQSFINMLIKEGVKCKPEAERKIKSLGLNLGMRNLVAVAGEIDDFAVLKERYSGSELNALIRSFVDMATAVLNDSAKALIAMVEEGKFVIIFSFEDLHSSHNIYDQVFKTITRLKTTIKRYLNITACFGMTSICNEIDQINQYYQRAEQILSKKFYEGKDRILFDATVAEVVSNIQMLDIKDEKHLLELAKSGAKEELLPLIGDIFDRIQRERPNPSATRMVFATLINIVNKVARDSNLQTAIIFGENRDPFEQLKRFDTVNEVREYIQRIYEGLFETMALYCVSQQYDEVTKRALDFMNKNYHEDLSLTEIAGYVGVNSSYLSRKFRKDCGKGIVEYLNALRIARAKLLMEEGAKSIKEIASNVGFNNYNYFFKVFKDTLGMTPLEYEKAVRA